MFVLFIIKTIINNTDTFWITAVLGWWQVKGIRDDNIFRDLRPNIHPDLGTGNYLSVIKSLEWFLELVLST
jgi:hypothetical protein